MLVELGVMRGIVALIVAAIGCGGLGDSHGRNTGAGVEGECAVDDDCTGAAPRCCDCPSFAVPVASPMHQACDEVVCPYTHCPRNVRPVCVEERCALACVAMECRQSCEFGFAADASGCLICNCAAPTLGCLSPADCVQVRGDCCGCARGGRDTAVLRADAAAHDVALHCPAEPQCPAIDTCDRALSPQCFQGRCVLASGAPLPPEACGRFDVAPCRPDEVCVVNGPSAQLSEQGLGLCMAPARVQDPRSP